MTQKNEYNTLTENRNTTANSRLPQVAVTWLIEGSCFYSASVQVDSLVLLNRHLRQAANRCTLFL
jgi:hypothetical protein